MTSVLIVRHAPRPVPRSKRQAVPMTIAMLSQFWIATFSLDPASCRELVVYLRALGAHILGDDLSDPTLLGYAACVAGIVSLLSVALESLIHSATRLVMSPAKATG